MAWAEAYLCTKWHRILIHPNIWSQYTRQTGQSLWEKHQSDSIGRTVLQTVAKNYYRPLIGYDIYLSNRVTFYVICLESHFMCDFAYISNWQDFYWRIASRGPPAIAELLVNFLAPVLSFKRMKLGSSNSLCSWIIVSWVLISRRWRTPKRGVFAVTWHVRVFGSTR